ncbi:hypothetical protein K227x_08970 [Rubripirellula lacrimiformis]|uniref:Uncharacterized protein n=2 Tax=Rubripirellula lacrimiformis TaxID=1930273 RepID=A0A517N5V0_9BACT|nr:hypothetical protein K227x_08970 [Rubripirellula lacrimiformis]
MLVGMWRDHREWLVLDAKIAKYESAIGRLDVTTESRMHLIYSDPGQPDRYQWRGHLPANQSWRLSWRIAGKDADYTQVSSTNSEDFFPRVRIDDDGSEMSLHVLIVGKGMSQRIGAATADLLRKYRDQLVIEVIAETETEDYPVDQIVSLLKIRLPESLRQDVVDQFGKFAWQVTDNGTLVHLRLGTDQALEAEEKSEAESDE